MRLRHIYESQVNSPIVKSNTAQQHHCAGASDRQDPVGCIAGTMRNRGSGSM